MRASDFGRRLPNPDPNSSNKRDLRQTVLLETLRAFEESSATRSFHKLAESNLQRWRGQARPSSGRCEVIVMPEDWGEVTSRLTEEHGVTFAVLNMANAYTPGGGYIEGWSAQEENMFRRTDCHFSINRSDKEQVQPCTDGFGVDLEYTPAMTSLLESSPGGKVYLDTVSPRVCIRGPEDLTRDDLGYEFLPDDQIFPFYELRAAAVNMRVGGWDPDDMRRRISAQLDTLMVHGVRHVVLSAFGCGAFDNPAHGVAAIYREEIERRVANFDVVAFAIFHAGKGRDNFTPFHNAFEGFGSSDNSTPVTAQSGERKIS